MAGLIGRKLGMTQIFDDAGAAVPVTVVEAGPCPVTQVKTTETDGYSAIQVGWGQRDEKHSTRAERGHAVKAGLEAAPRRLSEFRVEDTNGVEPGQVLTVEQFAVGEQMYATIGIVREDKAAAGGALLAVGGLWLLRVLVLAIVHRRTRDVRLRYRWRRTTSYVATALVVLLLVRIWVGSLGSLATFLGLVSAGLAIAMRDPLVNLAGWLFIIWKRPFVAGDRVRIRTHTGDVIDQRIFVFTLLEVGTESGAEQSTGRLIHIPNGWVFVDSLVNFTLGFQYVRN